MGIEAYCVQLPANSGANRTQKRVLALNEIHRALFGQKSLGIEMPHSAESIGTGDPKK